MRGAMGRDKIREGPGSNLVAESSLLGRMRALKFYSKCEEKPLEDSELKYDIVNFDFTANATVFLISF